MIFRTAGAEAEQEVVQVTDGMAGQDTDSLGEEEEEKKAAVAGNSSQLASFACPPGDFWHFL